MGIRTGWWQGGGSGLLVAIFLAAACGEPRAEPAKGPAAGGAEPSAADEIDRLRALPYLGFAERPAAAGERDGVVALDAARAAPGYRLHTLRVLCRAELLDLRGRVVHGWQQRGPCGHWGHAELVAGGDLLVAGRSKGSSTFLLRLAWDGTERWRRRMLAHHDVDLTPTGEVLTITKAGRRWRLEGKEQRIFDDRITRLAGPWAPLETLSLADLLARAPQGDLLLPTQVRQREFIDLLHANSVEWMARPELYGSSPLYAADHVLVSIRHQDLLAIVDWTGRRLVWAWGRGELDGPHDATLLDDGHVLVFDNGLVRGWSRVVEVDPATDRIVWQYRASPPESFYTATLGGAQRLPNGNTLIAHSTSGEAFEVTRDGEVVWRFLTPHKNAERQRAALVRMKLYPAEMVEPLLAGGQAGAPAAAR